MTKKSDDNLADQDFGLWSHEKQGAPTRILRIDEVEARTGYKKSAIYQKIKEGTFPPQFRIGRRAVGWDERDVMHWVNIRLAHA